MSDAYRVYMYTQSQTRKRYVGITGQSLKERAGAAGCFYRGSPAFYNAIKACGWDTFVGEILHDGLSKEAAAQLERECIARYRTREPAFGYNLQIGGFPEQARPNQQQAQRNARIRNTLVAQRASASVRAAMSARMRAEWNDPQKRASRLRARRVSCGGRPPTKLHWEETQQVFANFLEAAKAFGTSKTVLARALRHKNQVHRVRTVPAGFRGTLRRLN